MFIQTRSREIIHSHPDTQSGKYKISASKIIYFILFLMFIGARSPVSILFIHLSFMFIGARSPVSILFIHLFFMFIGARSPVSILFILIQTRSRGNYSFLFRHAVRENFNYHDQNNFASRIIFLSN